MSEGNETKGRCRSEVDNAIGPYTERVAIADALDRLAADVAAIKAKVDALSPEDVAHLVESDKAWVGLVEEKRDAAIRERDDARAEVGRLLHELAEARADSFAREDNGKFIPSEREWNELVDRKTAAIRERDEARAEAERLRGELAARPAANSSGIPNGSPAAAVWLTDVGAPDIVDALRDIASFNVGWPEAKRAIEEIERLRGELAARSAPGWLTDAERKTLAFCAQSLRQQRAALLGEGTYKCSASPLTLMHDADAIDALLARAGSPPVVEVPERCPLACVYDAPFHDAAYRNAHNHACSVHRAALDKAGVPWKEVPRE